MHLTLKNKRGSFCLWSALQVQSPDRLNMNRVMWDRQDLLCNLATYIGKCVKYLVWFLISIYIWLSSQGSEACHLEIKQSPNWHGLLDLVNEFRCTAVDGIFINILHKLLPWNNQHLEIYLEALTTGCMWHDNTAQFILHICLCVVI